MLFYPELNADEFLKLFLKLNYDKYFKLKNNSKNKLF